MIASHPASAAHRRSRVTVALDVPANRWLREEARARGWRLAHLWYCGGELPAGVVPRGALVSRLPDDPEVQSLLRNGCAVVRLGNLPHPGDADVPCVLPDLPAEGRLAAEHFAERGFREVGYFGNDPWSNGQLRFEGFRRRSAELGMACRLLRFRMRYDESRTENQVRRQCTLTDWLRHVPKPFGLLAYEDEHAAMYCACLAQAGLDVPGEVAVLSIGNNVDVCVSAMPTISSLARDEKGRIHAACELLDRLMAGEPGPAEPVLIPPKGIVERESTDVLATPDRVVAVALRHLWDHLDDQELSVESLAREAGLSSRQLARRFREALGRTVNAEIRRKRLEEVTHLLRSTDLALFEIAPLAGFRSTAYLHRAFRAAFGTTPHRYRQARKRQPRP